MASQFDRLIDSLWQDANSRALAHDFAARFATASPTMVEGILREAAVVNSRIEAGELTSQAGRELLSSYASEGMGLAPHLVAEASTWANGVLAQAQAETAAEPQAPPAEVAGPHAELIRKLFSPEDRAPAEALAKALDADPRSASRTEALLHEVARTTEMDPQTSYDYIASFARSVGIPEHLVTSALDAISAPAERAHEQQVMRELVGDLSPQHRAALSESERRQAREEADKYELMMRENPSEYWKPQNQEAYRQALERSIAVPVPAPPAAPADGGPAALPATAPPAATPPLTQPAPSSG
jgi:hypothetical protein